MSHLTRILNEIGSSDANAADQLLPLVYDELRQLAARKMAQELGNHTLQPTALVHEAWLRLGGDEQPMWENRTHFFCAAAEAMKRILIDRARRRLAAKRGGGADVLDANEIEIPCAVNDDETLLRLNEVLEHFATLHPRKAELVKLRYFAGMTFEESAATLGIAVPTAKQWWAYSRAWLRVEMKRNGTAIPETG